MKIGMTILCAGDYRPPVYREVPAVPRIGDAVTYDGTPHTVQALAWHGTDTTWTATILLLRRDPSSTSGD